jgi:hypothetical protein
LILIGCSRFGIRSRFRQGESSRGSLQPDTLPNASAAVTVGLEPDALTVPQAVVRVGQNGNYVFVIKPDQTAEVRLVNVSRTIDGKSVVDKGLNEGEDVAVDGQRSKSRSFDWRRLQITPQPSVAGAVAIKEQSVVA